MADIQDFKKYDSLKNILIPDISVDSDLRLRVEHWRVSVDSDYVLLRDFESDYRVLLREAGGVLDMLDSESRKGQRHSMRLDSENTRILEHYFEIQKLLDSEYVKNRQLLQNITGRLDSDEAEIQAAKTRLENLLDSEYIKNRQWFAYAQQRMDSDEIQLQHLNTKFEYLLDSEYRKNADWFAYAQQKFDSDEQKLQDNLTTLENRIDSEYAKNREWFAYAQQRLDSDQIAIQDNRNVLNNLLDSEYVKNREKFVQIDARLDSDEAFLQYVSVNYLKTVNGVGPDLNNNVSINITKTHVGTEANRLAFDGMYTGDVWVITGDADPDNDGKAYIFDSDTLSWTRISGFDFAQADARYVNTSGDTMTGGLTVPTLQVNAGEIVGVSPTVTLTGAVTGAATLTDLNDITIVTTHTADPTLTIDGAVSGSATFTNLGSVTLTTTASPTLTLIGDVTGSATFTDLANASLTTTVVEGNVDHDLLNNFVASEHVNHDNVSITAGNGLTGGGTIAATRTLTVLPSNSSITVGAAGISVSEANVSHDNLSGFVASEHVDHNNVSITAGSGLTGGGTIASSRTINVGAGNGITVNANDVAMSGNYTGTFAVTGNISATTDICLTSDVRLKKDITTIDGKKVYDMRGVHYTMNGKASSGVIAQELEEIAPELVIAQEDGYKSVAYQNLVGYLIETVKDLNRRIEELENGR